MQKISKSFWRRKKKQLYGREHYKNLSEDEKQKLVEYRKEYYRMRESIGLERSFEKKNLKNLQVYIKIDKKNYKFASKI